MPSVTQRISEIKQPRGGLLLSSFFDFHAYEDEKVLNTSENLHSSIIGLTVDYLTRVGLGQNKSEAFHISIHGARLAYKTQTAMNLLRNIKDLTDESIIAACKLSSFDVSFRAGPAFLKPTRSINPNQSTISNIRIMVVRSIEFFKKNGPITVFGPTFEGGYTKIIDSGDGDFCTKKTLWDLKVIDNKPKSKHRLQVLIYGLLAIASKQEKYKQIENIGIFNPRLNHSYLANIKEIDENILNDIKINVIGLDSVKIQSKSILEKLIDFLFKKKR
jgi:hypothetical protein